jgi:amino acid adenylation domain-containing protein
MTLLAAFQVLLHRYSGQDDIIVGSPIAGRGHLELEGLIGCFVNTLVMRTDLSGDPTFEELLCRVRETAVGAYTHQDLPFEKLVEELVSERDLSRNPIFQVMLNLQIAQESSMRLSDAVMDEFKRERENVKLDLGLELTQSDDGFNGILEYSRDLFEASTIDRMSGHLLTLLEGIVNQPWARLSELPILTQTERQKLLVDWNSNSIDMPSQQGIHTLFEEQAEHRADSVALVWNEQSISYRELNCRANQLAHYLKRQGVGPEMIVSICMERGIDLVVGLLATLKAGAAYMPMDPAYPDSRLELMLRDAAVTVLMTTAGVNARFDEYEGQTISLDDAWQGISQENADNPAIVVTGENLAYVIYTSGSTGGPKGVMIEHHSVIALVTWARQRFSDEELSGVLASTSLSFDISVFEILVPLALGGRVILVDSILQLPDLNTRDQIRIVNTVPSAISALVSANSVPSSVHTINLAGELLKQSLVEEIFRRTSVKRVYDLYGPSEDTVYSTCAERNAGGRASIGRPINNTEVFILDKNLNPVPVGMPGEIHLGGQGVARGYLNRPDLTAEKFIAHSFEDSSSKCLYRTGDFARYLDDGNIEFIGRVDNQVKLRGFRIELGEVEAALESHPDVQEAVAVVKSDVSGYEYLTAYLLLQRDADPVTADLLKFLHGLLPSYMVPTTMTKLDRFPLTLNGKVDRNALSNRADSCSEQESEKTGPRTPIEKEIVAIWSEVLNVEQVGIDDNFFELGGHSLMATQIISRIRDKLDVDLPLVKIFEVSTVAGLARAVEECK